MGLFNRLFRGRGASQLALALPRYEGAPRWAEITGLAAEIASEAIQSVGGGSYMDVISSMRAGYEQGRRSKAWRGQQVEDVLTMLAYRAVGTSAPKPAITQREGFMTVEEAERQMRGWKPAMSGKSPITEPGIRLRARQGAARYRAWLRQYDAHINAAAQAAGINKRQANSLAWDAYKEHQPAPAAVPSLIRAAIVGGSMESTMTAVRKPSKSTYRAQFAGEATAAQKKQIQAYAAQQRAAKAGKPAASKPKASSKPKTSGSRKTVNFPANICTPAGRVRKPSKAVWTRYFAKTATAAEKRHVIAYNAWKRAGSPPANTKASLSAKTAARKKKASASKKRASSKTASGKLRKPSKSTYRAQFAGEATAAQKKQIQAYAAQQRAAKAGKPAASKPKASSKPKSSPKRKKSASAKPAPVRKAKSAAAAAATVVKAAQSGKAMASGKTMSRKVFEAKYRDEINKAKGAAKGLNHFKVVKAAHEAFDRAPQGQKAKAITEAVRAGKKAGIFKVGKKAASPKKRATTAPKRKSSPKRARSSRAGSQRFKVAGSVTVSAA